MHCELVVPGLFRASNLRRFPALELLLARGRKRSCPTQTLENWVREAFELGDGPFPAGALRGRLCGGSVTQRAGAFRRLGRRSSQALDDARGHG